ncbi:MULTISPECIES: phosphate signaling complex protein PhoU [Aneurinibacillus]|jgi:phosphate transport system protein|uniref:Phosphate-specific transport system accessory protein PhoU n=1 Tax=Aneurinibacillus danicus TaxID=267746 RepID=A0A511V8N4_9BACL|nr:MULTISPECIES: phosphate signaling complex protein PhoU [Aneurinibacillus]GEN35295.1 phosphate transport system regulatory protein PhoU [Aneurinibacillus danicus]
MQERQLNQLTNEVAEMAAIAQAGFLQAWRAFLEADLTLAKEVIVRDEKLNVLAEKIFKMSLRLIALQAPVAADLRAIGSYLKIVTDLERIGDLSVSIAKVVVRLDGKAYQLALFEMPTMGEKVKEMLDVCVQAIKSGDARRLRLLDEMDDIIDAYYSKCFDYVEWSMERQPELIKEGVQLIKVLQSLERIGDHATNIGEWALYISTGSIADLNT